MAKRKKKRRFFSKPIVSNISICRYTWETWKRCHGDHHSSYRKWEKQNLPNDLFTFIHSIIEELISQKLIIQDDTNLKVVTIDEEYFAWLEQNKKDNKIESQQEYAKQVSPEEAFRLLKKNQMETSYSLVSLPVAAFYENGIKEETSYKLSFNLKQNLLNYFEQIFGKGTVYLPGYVVSGEELYNNQAMFLGMAQSYFEEDMNVQLGKWDTQLHEACSCPLFELYFIPFAVKNVADKAHYTIAELEEPVSNRTPELVIFEEEILREEFGIEDVPDLLRSQLEKEIKKTFCDASRSFVFENCISLFSIPEFTEMVAATIEDVYDHCD